MRRWKWHVAEPGTRASTCADANARSNADPDAGTHANSDTDSDAIPDAGRWNDVHDHVNRRFATITDSATGDTCDLHQQ